MDYPLLSDVFFNDFTCLIITLKKEFVNIFQLSFISLLDMNKTNDSLLGVLYKEHFMNFYDNIKNLTENKKGITLTEMVKILNLSTSMPSKWKDGTIPNGETLVKLADFLDVTTDYLLGRENKKTESTLLAYSGNEKVDSIINTLLNSSIDDDDLKIIEVVLDKYIK